MNRTILTTLLALTLGATSAQAQWGDILKKVDPNKIKKGAKAVHEATREFTEDEEADIGRIVAARILATYPLAKDEKAQQYVTLVGNTVAAYSARPTLEWHFAVVETPIVNAFSAPGGFVFLTTGLMKQLHSEAELAAVIGHEIGHTTEKHILKEIKRANTMSASLDLASETSLSSRLNDEMGSKIGDFVYNKLFTSGLSRRDELEADKIGVELAEAAGYRASEMTTFLETLKKIEHESEMKQFVSTHPTPDERIAALRSVIRDPKGGEVLAERWAEWTGGK